ncbi:hypothetical protein HWV62_6825 [Athelia sp. TMB]|nr:hypothetical protein HWV62_6825 [Athelia sp. TMB]
MSDGWTTPSSPSPNLATALAFMKALDEWDEEALEKTLDETLEHRILPKSLMRPVLTKSLYLSAYIHGIAEMFNAPGSSKPKSKLQRTIHEVIEMEDTIVIHASAKGTSVTGTSYEQEYMYVLRFTASTTGDPNERKIKSVKEFCDSSASKGFFPAERKRLADAKAAQYTTARPRAETLGTNGRRSGHSSNRMSRLEPSPSR